MNAERRKIQLPAWTIILDVLGTVFVVFGILAQFGGAEQLFPGALDLRQYAIVLILAGILLMLPLVIIIIRQATPPD